MKEYSEIIDVTPVPAPGETAKWLRYLLYCSIATVVLSVITYLPFPDDWATWVQLGLVGGTVFCLFRLEGINPRYRKAAVYRAVYLGGILINALLFSSTAILLAASILSIMSVYQEYNAHSDLLAEKDPQLSRKWHSLFTWSIAAAVLAGFGSMVISVITALMGVGAGTIVSVVLAILALPDLIVDIFYLVYLNRTVKLLEA